MGLPPTKASFLFFRITCRPAVGPTELRFTWCLGLFRADEIGTCVGLIAHLHLPRKFTDSWSYTSSPSICIHVFTKTTFALTKDKYCMLSQPIPVGVRVLACWDCGSESRREYECLSFVSVVCSTDRDLFHGQIPRPGVSYRVLMSH